MGLVYLAIIGLFVGMAIGGNTAMGYERGGSIGFLAGIVLAVVGVAWKWLPRRPKL